MYSRAYKTLVSLPPLVWVGTFLLLPYALVFAHSLWAVREGVMVHDWNLDNYKALLTNPLYAVVLFRTMHIAASVTLCAILLGYPLAYYLAFHAGARKELLYQLVIVPLWVSYLVRGYAWKTILGSDGVLNGFLQYLHLTREPVGYFLYSPFAVVLMLTHIYTPFVFLPIYGFTGSWRKLRSNVLARDTASLHARPARRRDVCVCSLARRLSCAAPGRRSFRHHDRKRGAKPLWRRF